MLVASILVVSLSMILPAGAQSPERDVTIYNQELVLCDTNGIGEIEKVRVFDWVSLSGDGTVEVRKEKTFGGDVGRWQGVHGFTTPVVEDGYIVWKDLSVDGNRNVLAGTELSGDEALEETRMKIPIEIYYEYWFDEDPEDSVPAEKIADPAKITGKSGHFRMECTMTNTSAETTEVEYEDPETGEMIETEVETYLPCVIAPYDFYFDNTVFYNLEADPTGIVFYMPDFYQVGWSVPLFPPATEASHTIWVEADVKNFRLPPFTLPVAFIFPETNQTDPTALFKSGLEMLYDGVKELGTGLEDAVEGVGSQGTPDTLLYGISQVDSGLSQLASASEGLPAAAAAIDSQLIPGVDQLRAGIGSETTPDTLLYADALAIQGLQGISAGIGDAGADGTLLYAMAAIQAGLNDMLAGIGSASTPDTLLYACALATQGLSDLKAGLQQASAGLGSRTAANTIIWALAQISANCDPTNPAGLYAAVSGVSGLMKPGGGGVYDYVSTLVLTDPSWAALHQPTILGTLSAYTPNLDAAAGGIQTIYGTLEAPLPNGIIPNLEYIKSETDNAIAGIGSSSTPDTLLYALASITGGLQFIASGIGSAATPDTLLYAVDQVTMGLNATKAGIGAGTVPDTLLYALAQMQFGLNQVKFGLASGDPNNPALREGLVELSTGVEAAVAGLGSASTPDTLLYGTSQIEGGLQELGTGLEQATTEGTSVMAEALMENLMTLNITEAELEAIVMRGEEFDHFLGRAENTDGNNVRFVFQTEAAYAYEDGNSWITALILSIIIGLLLIVGGFLLARRFSSSL